MFLVGVRPCGCVWAFEDADTLTPRASLALRSQWEREGLVVSLVPARNAMVRHCTHGPGAPQTELFQGDYR